MADAYNSDVWGMIRQNAHVPVWLKSYENLQRFDRLLAQELCMRDAAHVLEAIVNIPCTNPPCAVPAGVQQVVNAFKVLMENKPS